MEERLAYAKLNGIHIYYELKGNPEAAETVVFLNGVMASTNSWAFQVPVFEKAGFQVLLHDFRGQLLSDKPKGPYTFHQHAEDLKALLKELKIEKAHIIGTSYGGEVGMRFAVDFPQYVKTLAVIDSVSELDEILRIFSKVWKSLALQKDPEAFFWGIVPSIYGNTFLEKNREVLKKRAEALKQVDPSYFEGQAELYETFLLDVNMTGDLKNISCPTLVVCGQEDILKPVRFSKIIAEHIPNSEFAIIPDCGHVTIFEKPGVLNSMLLGFVLKHS